MGTRHLIEVVSDGQIKVAQYGQWDGYPSGKGIAVLEFLRKLVKAPTKQKTFTNNVNNCKFYTNDEIAIIDEDVDWKKNYPHISRDVSVDILHYIKNDSLSLINSHSFGGNSLFCEWAYVIDLDKKTFEVYKGFNKSPVDSDERFYGVSDDTDGSPSDSDYYPVYLLKSYPFDKLPTNREFLKYCEPRDD